MNFKKTFKNGHTLKVEIVGVKSVVSLNGDEKGCRFSRVKKNDMGIAWAFDSKYGLSQPEMDQIEAVLEEANRLELEAFAVKKLTAGEKAEKEYCGHYDSVAKAMSY